MKLVVSILVVALALVYPFVVYAAMQNLDIRTASYSIAAAIAVVSLVRAAVVPKLQTIKYAAGTVALCAFVGGAGELGDMRGMMVTPVVINLGLLVVFGSSLWAKVPLVERFARMQVNDLSQAEIRYCRSVTIVWCTFFVINASIAGILAVSHQLEWWTTYTGFIAYLLMGTLATVEYCVRKFRFGRYGTGIHDRMLMYVFGHRTSYPSGPTP